MYVAFWFIILKFPPFDSNATLYDWFKCDTIWIEILTKHCFFLISGHLWVCEICEPASHASHANHASHASHSANVKNFYLFYLHSHEKILDEFFSLFFFCFCYNFGENFAHSKSLKMRKKMKTIRKNLLVQDFRKKNPTKNIRLHRYSNRYLLTHVIRWYPSGTSFQKKKKRKKRTALRSPCWRQEWWVNRAILTGLVFSRESVISTLSVGWLLHVVVLSLRQVFLQNSPLEWQRLV